MKRIASMVIALSLIASPVAQAEPAGVSTDTAVHPAGLMTRNQTAAMMACHFNRTLDSGASPTEISEIIVRLAFGAGWSSAVSAAAIARDVFAAREISTDEIAQTLGELLMIVDEFPSMDTQDEPAKPMNGV